MLNDCSYILNNSAKIDYSYTVDNVKYENGTSASNTTSIYVLPSHDYYKFCFCSQLNLNRCSQRLNSIYSLHCDAEICDYYIEYINGCRMILIKVAIYQYIYYTSCYSNKINPCSFMKYANYEIPMREDCIDSINVEASYISYDYIGCNKLGSKILLQFEVV